MNQERVQVRIPGGVKPGSRLRLKEKGNLQPSSGRRGDLYLTINLDSHPVWRLDGDVLRAELPLSPAEAVLGGEVKVPTPDGEAVVNVPAGISAGRSLRFARQGLAAKRNTWRPAAHRATAAPNQPSDAERQLYQQLLICLATTHATACFKTPGSDWGIP